MKNFKYAAIAITTVSLLWSCSNSEEKITETEELTQEVVSNVDLSKGFQLLENNCFVCHSPDAGIDKRVAPPMFGVKKHYVTDSTTQEEFTADLIAYLNNPIEENSKMPGAIDKFGVMPKMGFSEEQIRAIAAYIYNTELEAPGWFKNHYQQERKRYRSGDDSQLSYTELGLKYAMATKSVLGKNLMGAVKNKGTEGAVEFCNERAYPLIDSVATFLNTNVTRVSDQPRNPNNTANELELAYINNAKAILTSGEKPKPQMLELNGKMVGYYPIVTNGMCMKCHGKPNEQINTATMQKITELYPEDQATGYGENELRGVFVVEMDKRETAQ